MMKGIFQTVFAAAIAALLTVSCAQQESVPEVTCSLYNLRTVLNTPESYAEIGSEVFTSLADMGYSSIEVACYTGDGFYGVSPEQFRADVEAAGLKVLASHVNRWLTPEEYATGDLTEAMAWWDKCIADHKAAGMQFIVWSYLPLPENLQQLHFFCDYLNEIGRRCAEQGLEFFYHNHSQEFQKIEDQVVLDYLLQNVDPALVSFEMDVYWVVIGKASPVAYFEKYPGRFRSVQFKDDFCRELGQSGMVGFDAIYRNLDLAGAEHLIVEIEKNSSDDWKACMKADIDYIRWLGGILK